MYAYIYIHKNKLKKTKSVYIYIHIIHCVCIYNIIIIYLFFIFCKLQAKTSLHLALFDPLDAQYRSSQECQVSLSSGCSRLVALLLFF